MLIDELVGFSNRYGANESLVLAGGGNTSAKQGSRMWVKGSGSALAHITREGFVEMDLDKLKEIFKKSYPDSDAEREALVLADLMRARAAGSGDKRPSVETTLHALFDQTYVLHLHPALVNGLTCCARGERAAGEVLGQDFIWIDQCRPGYVLAKLCARELARYRCDRGRSCDMLLLANHGIFLAADRVEQLDEKLALVLERIEAALIHRPPQGGAVPDMPSVPQAFARDSCVCFTQAPALAGLCAHRSAALPLLSPFTPDHIVYSGAYPLWLDQREQAAQAVGEYVREHGVFPRVLLLRGVGAFCTGKDEKQAQTVRLLFEDAVKIAVYTRSFGGARHMTRELTDFIVNWEVESYRSAQPLPAQ